MPLVIKLDELMQKIRKQSYDQFDLVVGIARGGILPGYLISRFLNLPFESIAISFRNDTHAPIYNEPKLMHPVQFDYIHKKILLVDDVSNSGASLGKAKEILSGSTIQTAVISGTADISFYGPHDQCIQWPWDPQN